MHPTQQVSKVLSFSWRWSEIIHRPNSCSRIWFWTRLVLDTTIRRFKSLWLLFPGTAERQNLQVWSTSTFGWRTEGRIHRCRRNVTQETKTTVMVRSPRTIYWIPSSQKLQILSRVTRRFCWHQQVVLNVQGSHHILKIHVLWDVTLDQWMNSSTFFKARHYYLSKCQKLFTQQYSVASVEDVNLWHHHSENAKYWIILWVHFMCIKNLACFITNAMSEPVQYMQYLNKYVHFKLSCTLWITNGGSYKI